MAAPLTLPVASRRSPLAMAQVEEVFQELHGHHPHIKFSCIWLDTTGDHNQTLSLRTLGKTDFFTKELDELLLLKGCRIAVHSAKDLPDPLPQGIAIAAITKGVDPSDALVLQPTATLSTLPLSPLIATSSFRREEAVKELIPHATFTDIRGNVNQRLRQLEEGKIDGVVIAEAALIRLGLTHLNRLRLPGKTVPLQGQLAITVRSEDEEMLALFACMDSRHTLYLGLELPLEWRKPNIFHYPIIKIIPKSTADQLVRHAFTSFDRYTHLIFTSKSTIPIFLDFAKTFKIALPQILKKTMIAVGKQTASKLKEHGIDPSWIATEESSEGIAALLQSRIDSLQTAHIFIPQSSLARPVLRQWLEGKNIRHTICPIYDTVPNLPQPLPDLKNFREIVFTSPSTVNAFLQAYGSLPTDKTLHAIGPVTQRALDHLS